MSNQKPNKAGKKWTDLDQCKLLDLVESENNIEDIAAKLERTVGAVKARLLKETYDLISQGDWTSEELSTKFKISNSEILRYQEREDNKKLNPPEKRVTRSQTFNNTTNTEEKRTFSSATKTRSILMPNNKDLSQKVFNTESNNLPAKTHEEKTLTLLTEIRDLLQIIADKK